MQRIRPGQVVTSRRVTVTSSGKIKARKNPKKDALEQSVDKTPFGPLIGALDFGKKRKKAKKGKARKAQNTRKRNNPRVVHIRYVTRDLGSGRERGDLIGYFTGTADTWGKRKFKTLDGDTYYFFSDEIKRIGKMKQSRNAKMSRFDRCVKSVTERGGAYDARAVCASAGRKKYGKKKFQAMAKAGKARAARKRAKR